jgi:hypothetical protein
MTEIIWNDRCINLLIKIVEYDIVRYSSDDIFAKLLELHTNKFNYFIAKGKYKTQRDFEIGLYNHLEFFKKISIPDNLVY